MIRTFVIPNQSHFNVALNLPEDYVGQEVEIIAFKKQEVFPEKINAPKKFVSFDAIKIDTSNFKFDRDQANER
ncbi:MAG: hypothetical protein ACK504_07780 [Bacteroidota bacterium]